MACPKCYSTNVTSGGMSGQWICMDCNHHFQRGYTPHGGTLAPAVPEPAPKM
ncbi:hypothetical protein [Streptomyces sp. NPDC054765]